MFENSAFDGHERVVSIFEPDLGLRCFIALHSTVLGPAAGGCRVWTYASAEDGLTDALKLSRGMTYKNAMAGLKFGGGKAVMLGPIHPHKRDALFAGFGEAVGLLGGAYITAEDVGVSVSDMEVIATRTRFVSGLRATRSGVGGNPSPYTAKGVAIAIEAAVSHVLKRSNVEGLTVAVQGLGGVGANLCRELHERGARLIVADIDKGRVDEVCDLFGAETTSAAEILFAEADVLSPCALGGAIDETVATHLRASIVVGGANNQLASSSAGRVLRERNIAYAPDYVVNAGGIIAVSAEYFADADPGDVDGKIAAIGDRVGAILRLSDAEHKPAQDIADEMARTIVADARRHKRAA